MSERSQNDSAMKSVRSNSSKSNLKESHVRSKSNEKSESHRQINERPIPRKPATATFTKNPIYIQVDIDYYDQLEKDGFSAVKKIKERSGCDVLEIDESIKLETKTSRFLKIDSKDNKNKYDASDGFIDRANYCLKSNYLKRNVTEFVGQQINNETEEVWGNKYVVAKCSNFGKYYENVGLRFCRLRCPDGFKDRGMMCEKPYRFKGQKIFTYSASSM